MREKHGTKKEGGLSPTRSSEQSYAFTPPFHIKSGEGEKGEPNILT